MALGIVITATLLSGCSSSDGKASNTNINTNSKANTDSNTNKNTVAADSKKEKKLNAYEKTALEYVNVFMNGTDPEAKKAFITDNIHTEVQPIFQLLAAKEVPESSKLQDPKVLESQDYKDKEGKKNKIVLIEGTKSSLPNSEIIVLFVDEKIVWVTSATDKQTFDVVRKEFKHPIPENSSVENSATDPKATLQEIQNFIVSDIWNTGFVDISWYLADGTSSTGESLDIDFTMEQLGKAIDKKSEYDKYIQSLSDEYSSVKNTWGKLSAEVDLLYKHLQSNPPKANDSSNKLDNGKLKQYMQAFEKDVSALN
ncbi:hypothetical protein ACFRAM_02530 [Paenibacillus sp. NPDC056722]|uniref:hypothetical protein n=1 Tax=Paenibacillus sp. NPDC056722 TaxID=3345924 RepID=UPI0036935451